MSTPHSPIPDLPVDLAERLHRLARTQTAGSRPWPGVDRALRRAHRRRVTGVCGVTAAGLLLAGAAYGGLLGPAVTRPAPVSPAVTPSAPASPLPTSLVQPGPMTLERAGYTGAIGGSLATDTAWLAALRTRVIQLWKPSGKSTVRPPKDVLVLWAGDLDGGRYAVVLFPAGPARPAHPGQVPWSFTTLTGPAGAAAGSMRLSVSSRSGSGVPTTPEGAFLERPGSSGGVVFVAAPRASGIDVATSRRFSPTGQVSTGWRPLEKQGGAVWVGSVNPAELYLSSYRMAGMGDVSTGDSISAYTNADAVARAAAVPGTDLNALDSATDQTQALGSSNAEHPVLATGLRIDGRSTLAATVLESPDGGFLYGFAERTVQATAGPSGTITSLGLISTHPFPGPDAFMTAIRTPDLGYLVIAPAGATSVRIGATSVPVQHRLAVLPVSASGSSEQAQVQALGPDGAVLATVTSTRTDDENETDFGPDRPRH